MSLRRRSSSLRDDPDDEDQLSKRKANARTHFNADPARANVRDPEQKNDELERHEAPPLVEPKKRGVIPPEKD